MNHAATPRARRAAPAALLLVAALGCGDDPPELAGPSTPEATVVRHAFGVYGLEPGEEIDDLCLSWTLENDQALYVQAATLSNDGFWHHSNWTVVPDTLYPGPDGYWRCRDRGFNQVVAAISGTVLMAQSTQSVFEEQRFPTGIVVKIPPRSRIVAGIHFLNTTGVAQETDMRMGLELLHPREVRDILRPFHLDNRLLELPPRSETRHRMSCDLTAPFEAAMQKPLDLKVRFVLPHFHKRANAWRLEIVDRSPDGSPGPRHGEVVHEVLGFNADANGLAFDPPLDLTGVDGLQMTCGYVNRSDETLVWGVGENEMCEMLGLATGDALVDVAADRDQGTTTTVEDGIPVRTANACRVLVFPPAESQGLPAPFEVDAPLYVPPTDDPGVVVRPECTNTPAGAEPDIAPTLSNLSRDVFEASCAHNVCHGGTDPQQGLLLDVADPADPAELAALRARLLAHEVSHPEVDIPLVTPGDPDRSYLYRVLSDCQPGRAWGLGPDEAPKMPVLRPDLLDPGLVARVRAWIAAGAPAN